MSRIKVLVIAMLLVGTAGIAMGNENFLTGQHRQITNQSIYASCPAVDPSGSTIAYYGGPEGTFDVYTVGVNGGPVSKLTTDGHASTPSFTKDGNSILYNHGDANWNWNLWKMGSGGNNQHSILNDPTLSYAMPSELQDGTIVYETWNPSWSISTMNGDGTNRQPLPGIDSYAQQPRVSPDGRYIVYQTQNPTDTVYDVYLYDRTTGIQKQLTTETAQQGYPSFSPDGNWITYQSKEDGGNYFNIWAMDLNGGERQQLTFENTDQLQPVWLPDGSGIVYCSREDGGQYLDLWEVPVSLATDSVPEPLTMVAVGMGIAGLGGYIRRRRMASK